MTETNLQQCYEIIIRLENVQSTPPSSQALNVAGAPSGGGESKGGLVQPWYDAPIERHGGEHIFHLPKQSKNNSWEVKNRIPNTYTDLLVIPNAFILAFPSTHSANFPCQYRCCS